MELVIPSCVRDYHMERYEWQSYVGEELLCKHEIGNVDQYAIAASEVRPHLVTRSFLRRVSSGEKRSGHMRLAGSDVTTYVCEYVCKL